MFLSKLSFSETPSLNMARPITILSVFVKLIELILKNQIKESNCLTNLHPS